MNLRKKLHLDRSGQISRVLARHGLDDLARSLGLKRFAAFQKLFRHEEQKVPFTQPEPNRIVCLAWSIFLSKRG